MRKKFIMVMLCILILTPSALDAGLSKRDFKMIRVAFFNGCLRTLQIVQDEAILARINANREAMMEILLFEAEAYMKKLETINK